MWDYIYRKRAEWITGGKIDEEWEEIPLLNWNVVGLEEWIQIKQTGYDNYFEGSTISVSRRNGDFG